MVKIKKRNTKKTDPKIEIDDSTKNKLKIKIYGETKFAIENYYTLKIVHSNHQILINEIPIDNFIEEKIIIMNNINFPHIIISIKDTDKKKKINKYTEIEIEKIYYINKLNIFYPLNNNLDLKITDFKKEGFLRSYEYLEKFKEIGKIILDLIKKFSVHDIFLSGDKKTCKTTLSIFLLNFILNRNKNEIVNFTNLDLGKQSFFFPGYICINELSLPVFTNSTNSFVFLKNNKKYFLGENNPNLSEELYYEKIKSLFENINNQYINIINYHGFSKGYGKIIKSKVCNILKNFIEIEITKEEKLINLSIYHFQSEKKKKNLIKKINLDFKNKIKEQPEKSKTRLNNLLSDFLLHKINIKKIDNEKILLKLITKNKTEQFYKKKNFDYLDLIYMNSPVNIDIHTNKGIFTYFGLYLFFESNINKVVLNIPFCDFENEDIIYVEIIKTNYMDYFIGSFKNSLLKDGNNCFPFYEFNCFGVGAKNLRNKNSVRKN